MSKRSMTVGELAKATGLTVRTLHYYDRVGLLRPSGRTPAGYRLYTDAEVRRLYAIRALRSVGLPLADVAGSFQNGRKNLGPVLRRHREALRQAVDRQNEMIRRLTKLIDEVDDPSRPIEDQLIELMEGMAMFDRYFTPEQRAQLEERRKAIGEGRIKAFEQDWKDLIAEVEGEMRKGTDPASPRMKELARHWRDNLRAFTGGDPGIMTSLKTMYESEGIEKASRGTLSPEVMAYMNRVLEVTRGSGRADS